MNPSWPRDRAGDLGVPPCPDCDRPIDLNAPASIDFSMTYDASPALRALNDAAEAMAWLTFERRIFPVGPRVLWGWRPRTFSTLAWLAASRVVLAVSRRTDGSGRVGHFARLGLVGLVPLRPRARIQVGGDGDVDLTRFEVHSSRVTYHGRSLSDFAAGAFDA